MSHASRRSSAPELSSGSLVHLVGATLLVSLSGCGGDGDDGAGGGSGADANGGGGIVGLYERRATVDGETDVFYVEITGDGRFLVYDYQQDGPGDGRNCSTLAGSSTYVAFGGDAYVFGTGGEARETRVTRTATGLTLGYEENVTFNGFPQVITVVDTLTRVTAFTATDLALCPGSAPSPSGTAPTR